MKWFVIASLLVFSLAIVACGGTAIAPTVAPSDSAQPSPALSPTGSPTPTPEPATVTILGGGDVMLGRTLGEGIAANGPLWPFARITDVLASADIAFVNLESPLTDGGEPTDKDFVFRGPPEASEGIAGAGIDVVSLANNHALDYGLTGLRDTWAALNDASIVHVGSGERESTARASVILERNGLRIAFLAYVNTPNDSVSGFVVEDTKATADRPGVAWLTTDVVTADVAKLKAQVDLVVVSLHTGTEYTEAPTGLQTDTARAAIDAGASVVFGHHPHVLQGIETYNGGVIIYSLGNLVFDFDSVDYLYPGLPSALSGMLRVELSKDGVVGCEFVPMIVAEEDGRPRTVAGDEAEPVLERMRRLSSFGEPVGADGSCGL
ncbi:MAG: CapA family protein [Dehalococcoidia bacterium]